MKLSNEEKFAEEYYYKTYPVTLNIGEEERKKKVTDIFLAGFEASRSKWHTDSNDLPPMIQDERHISEIVWINVENWGTEDGYYDYNKNCWIIRCRIVNLPILGWIEIPKWEI